MSGLFQYDIIVTDFQYPYMVVAYQFFDTVAPGDFVKCDFLLYHFIRGENKGFQYIDFLFDLLDQFLYLFGIGD